MSQVQGIPGERSRAIAGRPHPEPRCCLWAIPCGLGSCWPSLCSPPWTVLSSPKERAALSVWNAFCRSPRTWTPLSDLHSSINLQDIFPGTSASMRPLCCPLSQNHVPSASCNCTSTSQSPTPSLDYKLHEGRGIIFFKSPFYPNATVFEMKK